MQKVRPVHKIDNFENLGNMELHYSSQIQGEESDNVNLANHSLAMIPNLIDFNIIMKDLMSK